MKHSTLSSSQNSGNNIIIRRFICFFKLLGTSNYYRGVDKPNVWQWLYSWRLSVKTAWKLACILWPSNGL